MINSANEGAALHGVLTQVKAGQHRNAESQVEDGDSEGGPPHRIVIAQKHQNRRPAGGHEHNKAKQRERHRYRHATANMAVAAITPAIIASA